MATPRLALFLLRYALNFCIEHPVNATPLVFPVDPESFQADVIERSSEAPVIVLFWAEQMPETLAARQFLDTRVNALSGKVLLAIVDVAADQSLAQHLRVQTLPSIRVVKDGQLLEQLDGPQGDEELAALCDRLTLSSAEVLQEQLSRLVEAGDFEAALSILKSAIAEEPSNSAFRVELADVLIYQGDLDEAKTVLASISDDTPNIARPRARLSIAEEASSFDNLSALLEKHANNAGDLQVQYEISLLHAAENRIEEALEAALDILCTDRKFRDDIGRLTMLRIFELLPSGDPLATSFRRRMFNFMH